MSVASLPATGEPAARRIPRGWQAVVFAMFCCGWGGNQFTPLLVMYRDAGYTAVTVDALLGAYVVGLVPGLLLAGRPAARYGRKPVMLVGTVLSLLASVLLALGAASTVWLVLGRFVTGFGVAVAMVVGSSWVKELADADPESSVDLGTRRGALWLTLGLCIGPGIAGVFAQWGPWPMVLPYLVHAACTLAAVPWVLRSGETLGTAGQRGGGRRFAGMRHPRFVRVVTPMAPWIFGSLGLAYAVMPELVDGQLGHWGLAYSTLLTVCALGAGVGIQPVAKRLDRGGSARAVIVAMLLMTLGVLISVLAAVTTSPWLALLTALVLGIAYGIAIVSGLLELQRLAEPDQLADLTGVYYALAYVGFLLPSVLAALGQLVSYVVLLSCLAALALSATLFITRHSRRHLPGLTSA